MSEPMSSTEIEDVLSSIRRLVSDDMRPAPKVTAAPGDKLILTPALRVVQTEAEPLNPVASAAVSPMAEPQALTEPRPLIEPRPLAEPQRLAEPRPMFVAVPRSNLLDLPRSGLGGVVASVSAAVDAAPDDWEAETGDSAPQPDATLANPWSLDEALAADEAVAERSVDAAPADPFEEHAPEAAMHAQTPAWAQEDDLIQDGEAEPATAPLHGTVEPDAVWADAAEASVLAALAEPDVAEPDAFELGMRFDEDVLHELVRDMLREELAGKMGERITRNIRKLVRAEIARALAAQEFE